MQGERSWWVLGVVSIALLLHAGCGDTKPSADVPNDSHAAPAPSKPPKKANAVFVRKIPWAGHGKWLKIDTHIHTRFSDGAHTVDEIAEKALEFGCDAIAITDHAESNLEAATPEYAAAIRAARKKFPQLVILAGLEWNLPPYGGREHVTLLVPQDAGEWEVLTEFKARFDHFDTDEPMADATMSVPSAIDAIAWLEAKYSAHEVKPVLFLNHPSRKRDNTNSIIDDMRQIRSESSLLVGFSGAPGHQAHPVAKLGAFSHTLKTIDRWDPAVAIIGGAWDQMLAMGEDAWAARAASDLHRATMNQDYWPGEFSETWAFAPDRSAAGVLAALRAGSFFGAHGHIARRVALTVDATDLKRMAMPGEAIRVPAGSQVSVSLRMRVPQRDWRGNSNRIDEVELITVDAEGAHSFVKSQPKPDGSISTLSLNVPEGGLVIRARGRRAVADGPDLLFYTNPIRILASKSE